MKRHEIDVILHASFKEAGIKQYQVAWSASPATLSALIGNDLKSVEINTRITKRRLKEVCEIIAMWGRLLDKHRARKTLVREPA